MKNNEHRDFRMACGLCLLCGSLVMVFGLLFRNPLVSVIGMATVIAGIGCFRRIKIFWYIGIAACIACIAATLIMVPFPVGIIPIAMGAADLYYLTKPNVKQLFLA